MPALNPGSLQSWLPTDRSAAQLITDPDQSQMEEKILEVPLESSNDRMRKGLVVSRRANKEFQVLTTITLNPSGSDATVHNEKKVFNIHSAHIIPRYAFPLSKVTTQVRDDFELCFPGASSGHTYTFPNEDDRLKFQQALIGYKVVFQDSCNWLLHFSGLRSEIEGSGILQIFQPKTLPAISATSSQNGSSPVTQWLGRNDSVISNGSTLTASTGLSGLMTNSNGSIIAEHPHSPLVVIFTEIGGQLTFLRVARKFIPTNCATVSLHEAVTQSVKIKPERCACGSRKEEQRAKCKQTFLGSTKDFPLWQFSTSTESQWNLALLSRPQHPEFERNVEKVKHVNYLGIETKVSGTIISPNGVIETNQRTASQFQKAIGNATIIRDRQLDNFKRCQKEARFESETLRVLSRTASSPSVLSPGSRSSSNGAELESFRNVAAPGPRNRAPSSLSVSSSAYHRYSNATELESISSVRWREPFGNTAELRPISNATDRASISNVSELESFTSAVELE